MAEINMPLSLTQVAALIRATPHTLRSELDPIAEVVQHWHPAPQEWCVNEVIGHLIEADRRGFDGRIRIILEADRPQLEGWDMNAVAAQRRDCEQNLFSLIDELEAMRAESAQLVSRLTPAQLTRSGIHPLVGELRIVDILHEWIHHDRTHVKQILDNIQAFVWPNMGNAQQFSQLEQQENAE